MRNIGEEIAKDAQWTKLGLGGWFIFLGPYQK